MGISLSGLLGGASALDRELNAKAKGTREAGQASSALDQALAKAQQDKAMSALDMELKGSQAAEHRARAASLAVPPKKKYTHLPVTVNGTAMMAMQDEEGNIVDARTKQPLQGEIAPFAPPRPDPAPSFTPVTLGGEDGAPPVVKSFNSRTGAVGPTIGTAKPAAAGGKRNGTIQKAIATNSTQVSVIDDALKELSAQPGAVGLNRGLGDLPFMGKIGDSWNQRKDPKGIAARAAIGNISSMVIHDRSGSAVTVGEFPRFTPFIPQITDTPEAIRIKLGKLRKAIMQETELLQGSAAAPSADGQSGDVDLRDTAHVTPAERAALKQQGFTDAQIDAIKP